MKAVSGKYLGFGLATGAGREPAAPRWGWLRAVASLRFTLVVFALLTVGVIWIQVGSRANAWPIVPPLILFAVNLMAAIWAQPAFRRQPALLVFHLALLAIVGLAALGRLTYLKGHMELTSGETFAGRLADYEAGPLHPWGIREVRFGNEGFTIDYLSGRQRDHTSNRVSYEDESGQRRRVIIGDQVPLALAGYRFYTSFNKGFALMFQWVPREGSPQRGTVHLPAYPIHEYRQANTWTPPGASSEVWVQLRFDEPLLDPNGPARFRAPGSHIVVVRTGKRRAELIPGAGFDFDGGHLIYEGVRTWMGYKVFYDKTIPWLLAACVMAVGSLAIYFWGKYRERPWWSAGTDAGEGV